MNFDQVMKSRYSVREYQQKPVEDEKIQAILEAVRLAPTAKNSQPYKLYVAKTQSALEKMDEVTPNRFGAPVAVLVCGDTDRACILKSNGRNFLETDVSIIQTYMMLKATELGLGTCWIGRFTPEKVYEVFPVPKNESPFGILLIGYKSENSRPATKHEERLSLDEFVKILN